MIRKIITSFVFSLLVVSAMAVPAKRGIYKMLTLSDGTTIKAELRGDEHVSYWQSEDGRTFVQAINKDYYVLADVEKMVEEYHKSNAQLEKKLGGPRFAAGQQPGEPLVGEMKGLIILVEFADKKFKPEHTLEFYQDVANTEGFTNSEGFNGSVRDYFLAQSDGLLDYTFDVVGPVTLENNYAYYGKNGQSQDVNLRYFVEQSLNGVDESVDFSQYDNDGDGIVDQVFFLYAGKGEADSGEANTIWPHMYYAYSGFGIEFYRNGVWVDVYACSNELSGYNRASGIGAICHEFSHCLGLPDMYDTAGGNNYGNDDWDVMHSGNYLGNSFTPCGYTAYERAYCGWRPLIELTDDIDVENLPILSEGGSAYVKYNETNHNEYYIFEPRGKTGWDSKLPGNGLLVYHVDYSPSAWHNNTVNNTKGHQRCAIVAADNSYGTSSSNVRGDAFPYNSNNSFGDNTTPAAQWFNYNELGTTDTYFLVSEIVRNTDNTVGFKYEKLSLPEYNPDVPEGALFYESFGRHHGKGGNDGIFNSASETVPFNPDQVGWQFSNARGANECALIGNASNTGGDMWAFSPEIEIEEGQYYQITFKAAPYSIYTHDLNLTVRDTDRGIFYDYTFPMKRGQWTECDVAIKSFGKMTMSFYRDRMFYLDEVLIMPIDEETAGVENIHADNTEGIAYNLAGQRVGNDYRGIVICNGRKYLKK